MTTLATMEAPEVVDVPADLARLETTRRDRHPVTAYLAGYTGHSLRTFRLALERVAVVMTEGKDIYAIPWHLLRFDHTAHIKELVAARWSPSSARLSMTAVRGVLKACRKLRLISSEDYQDAIDIGSIRGFREPKGRALTHGETVALLQACQEGHDATAARDAALLAILWAAGLRRAEAVGMDLADLKPDTGEIRVIGKGNKERVCYLHNGAAAAVAAWIQIRGAEPGPLFFATTKGGKIVQRRLTDHAVFAIVRKLCRRAGVADCGCHDFRRTFASELIDAGADLVVVQKLMGHSSPALTARYDRRGEAAKCKAAGLRHFPFAGAAGGSGASQAGGKVA